MKKSIVLFVLAFVCLSFGQNENWNGWGDTARVVNLYKDTTIYTGKFKLSAFENMRAAIFLRDTSAAGFGSDSVNVEWGIQWGHPCWNTTLAKSPTMVWQARLVIDTVNMRTAANFTTDTMRLATDGTFTSTHKKIDSVTVSGWAYQDRAVTPEWDVYFRFFAHALAQTKNTKNIDCVFQTARRLIVRAAW
jgi:hypothetical protein